jgi:predicted secreted protein
MTWVSFTALYFITWWVVLFAILPFGLRTQDDEKDVTLGTVSSAPRGSHMLRALLWTTMVTTIVIGTFYVLVHVLGYSIDDIPHIIPSGADAT